MLKIESLTVKNYKNIAEANLTFSDFNVLVGSNNAGKSNFIQVLSFLNFIINGSPDAVATAMESAIYPLPFLNASEQELASSERLTEFCVKILNTKTENAYTYKMVIQWYNANGLAEIIKEELLFKNIHKTGKGITIFRREEGGVMMEKSLKRSININQVARLSSVFRLLKIVNFEPSNIYLKVFEEVEKVLKTPVFYFSNMELTKSQEYDRTYTFKGRTVAFDLEQTIKKLKDTSHWPIFKGVLQEVLQISAIKVESYIPWLPAVGSPREYIDISVTHFNMEKSIRQLSDGSILVIALVTKILSSFHDIFLIEEPENSLHPKALASLVEFMASFEGEKQFILTTHSETLINSVKPENVMVAKTRENGLSEMSNIANAKEMRRKLKKGHLNFSDFLFFGEDEGETTVY